MSQINREFLIDSAFAVSAFIVLCRVMEIRIRRNFYLNKYKEGSFERENIKKTLKIWWFIIPAIVTAAFTAKTIFDINQIIHSSDSDKTFILIFVPVAVLLTCGIAFGIAYFTLIKNKRK